jgi:hypothetical protein
MSDSLRNADGYDRQTYFAAAADPVEVAARSLDRVERYRDYLRESGLYALWQRSHSAYFRGMEHRGRIRRSGKQAQYHLMAVNHYRNLLTHLKTMTVGQRPNFEAQAQNDDKASMNQAELANGLLNYYLRAKNLERHFKGVVELALVFGEGFLWTGWDPFAGEVHAVDPDSGGEIREGDLTYRVFRPHDVARDFTKDSHDHHDWYVLCEYASRFELAGRYPALADRILALPTRFEATHYRRMNFDSPRWETDDVEVFRLVHRKTAALPEGRMVEFLAKDLVLTDGPLPYERVPLARCAAGEFEHSPFAYTPGFDLLPLQDATDRLHSTIMTNQAHFGVQNIAAPVGSGVKVSNIADGLKLVEYDPKYGPPQPLQLVATAPELFEYTAQLNTLMEIISSVNSVTRGQADPDQSGSALALIQSMTIQYTLDLQQSYAAVVEETGTDTISVLKTFAKTKRVAEIAGKSNRSEMVDFTGDDLSTITRVSVDIGNPVLRTTAGKSELAQQYVDMGLVTTPEQLVMVKTTGQLKPIYDAPQSRLQRIRGENEKLAEGIAVPVLLTDSHHIDIPEHLTILDSPEAREDGAIVSVVLDHINQHIQFLGTMDPLTASILGIPVAGPMAPIAGPAGASGAPATAQPTSQPGQEPAQPQQPNLPTNPATGQPADVPTGGGPYPSEA